MALTFRIYRLRYVKGDLVTDLRISPEVVELSEIEEVLELEEGGFRLGNVSATVRGVAEDYFRGAADVNAPFVFEVADGETAIWHGPVEAASIDYDQGSGYTSFTARSWEAPLAEAGSVPARSVYEADILFAGKQNNRPMLTYRNNVPLAVGDTIVVDGTSGEVRETVRVVGTRTEYGGTWPFIEIDAPPPVYPVVDHARNGRTRSDDRIQIDFTQQVSEIVRRALPENGSYDGQSAWWAREGQVAQIVLKDGGAVIATAPIRWIQYSTFGDTILARAETIEGSVTAGQWAATDAVDLRIETRIKDGDKSRILGGDFYGYLPTPSIQNVEIKTVIEAMLSVGADNEPDEGEGRPLGVLPNVVTSVAWETFGGAAGSEPTIPRVAELPDKPLEALRLLQQTGAFFVRFVPGFVGTGASRIPSVSVKLIRRKVAQAGTVLAAPAPVIRSWNEKAANDITRAVVVKANEDYRKPDIDADYIGVWFEDADGLTPDTLTPERLRYLAAPTGNGVINVEVAMVPAWRGDYSFAGGGKQVVNDDRLKAFAQSLWSYYSAGTRSFNASLALGNSGTNYVGRRVSFDESGFESTVFITRRAISVKEGALQTSISGLIEAAFVEGELQAPVAVISGNLYVIDPDPAEGVPVRLNGNRSFSTGGEALTYLWERRPLGGPTWTTVGTGIELEDTAPATAGLTVIYEYRLTVTGVESALTGTDTEQVIVIEAPPGVPDVPGIREYFDIQYLNSSGEGEVKLYLARPDAVRDVFFRATSGAELPEIDWSVDEDPATWYADQRLAETDSDDRGTYWLKSTPISFTHLSYIEAYVRFDDELLAEPLIIRWNFDSDVRANLRDVTIRQTDDGAVYVIVQADEDTSAIRIQSTYGDNILIEGNYVDDGEFEVTHAFEPGDAVGITVTAYSGAPGLYTVGDVWNRSYVYAVATATSGGEYFSFTPREVTGAPSAAGTLLFDQDTGDGAGNPAGLQIKHVSGWATVWDSVNDGPLAKNAENESITGAWTFATAPVITTAGTGTTQAVRGDRSVLTGSSLTGGGNLTTNRTLDTIQDIRTTATPRFARLGLGKAAHASRSIDATGQIVTTSDFVGVGGAVNLWRPLTGGGWARGVYFYNSDGTTSEGGISTYGVGDNPPERIGIAFGASPWSSNLGITLRQYSGGTEFRLGVGRTDPSFMLDVAGSGRVGGALYTAGSGLQVGTETFASGFGGNGYRISRYTAADTSVRYAMEADSLTIRGTFNVYEILAREISAVNGNLFISAQNTIDAFTAISGGYTITTREAPRLTVGSFVIGQMLASNMTSLTLFRARVTAQDLGAGTITVATLEGAPLIGMTLARYDHLTDADQRGYVYIATSDSGAPFQSVRYGNGSGAWPVATEMLRLGRLDGLAALTSATGADAFGLAVGAYGTGWMSARGTSGIQFWQGSYLNGYINADGFFIGDTDSHIAWNAEFEEFELTMGGRSVITASASGTTRSLFLGESGTTVRLTGASIHVDGATTFASGYSPSDVRAQAEQYVLSRGDNLVTNGTALLGDATNFPGWTYDASRATAGPGSFRTLSGGSRFTSELIPVDPTQTYRLSMDALADPYTGNRHYSGVACYDMDGRDIVPLMYMRFYGSVITTLAAPLAPGDNTIQLTDATGWNNAGVAHQRSIRMSGYVSDGGYAYGDEYSRFAYGYWPDGPSAATGGVWPAGGIVGNEITLSVPWAGPAYPAGTRVSNALTGGSYPYLGMVNTVVPNEWTSYSGTIGGIHTDVHLAATDKFVPGTAMVTLLWLPNRLGITGAHAGTALNIDNVRFELDAPRRNELGDAAYVDLIEDAMLGTTVIVGGLIRTELIDVDTLFASTVIVGTTGTGILYLNPDGVGGTGIALSIGNDLGDWEDQQFRVYYDGSLVATNASISGTLQTGTATSGFTGTGLYASGDDFYVGGASGSIEFDGSSLVVGALVVRNDGLSVTVGNAEFQVGKLAAAVGVQYGTDVSGIRFWDTAAETELGAITARSTPYNDISFRSRSNTDGAFVELNTSGLRGYPGVTGSPPIVNISWVKDNDGTSDYLEVFLDYGGGVLHARKLRLYT